MIKSLFVKTVIAFCLIIVILIFWVHPFLAVINPIDADILVIESWISDEALKHASALHEHIYKHILIVGLATDSPKQKTSTEISKIFGLADSSVHFITGPKTDTKKTLAHANAIRHWLDKQEPFDFKGCNVISEGVHARKSYIVYRRVLKGLPVGIIAARPSEYNPKWWWVSLTGWQWIVFDTFKTIRATVFGY